VAQDCAGGRPSLAQMISEALVVPAELRRRARSGLGPKRGGDAACRSRPRVLVETAIGSLIFWTTSAMTGGPAELRAVGCKLYPIVCNFVLKTRGHWLARARAARLVERAALTSVPSLKPRSKRFSRPAIGPQCCQVLHAISSRSAASCSTGFARMRRHIPDCKAEVHGRAPSHRLPSGSQI